MASQDLPLMGALCKYFVGCDNSPHGSTPSSMYILGIETQTEEFKMKFHGEYIVKVKIGVRVDSDTLEGAQQAVRDLSIMVDDTDDASAWGWEVDPEAVYLFEGDE